MKEINLLTCMVRYDDFSVPVGYEIIKKDITFSDIQTKQERRKSSIIKSQLSRNLLERAVKNNMLFDYILGDNWYGSYP